MNSQKKLRSKTAFKHGAYAVAITAVVIAVAIVINLLVGLLSGRVNLNVDLSLDGANSLSGENLDFLKHLDKDVTVTVCADRDSYVDGRYLNYYTAQSYYSATASTTEYYEQTVKLLDQYAVASSHIKINFVDPLAPEFSAVQSKYADAGLKYGDLIVEATHTIDGEEVERNSILTFDDVYYLADPSGYAQYGYDYYYVQGNYLESALTSAIYKVTTADTKKATLMSTHCDPATVEYLTGILKLNNFDIAVVADQVVTGLDEGDLLIIAAPTEDFLPQELEAIDTWLYNGGQKGRGLLFFGSVTSPSLPNLYEYLAEWGIAYDEGVLFETNERNYMPGDPMSIGFTAADGDDDAVKTALNKVTNVITGGNLPMSQAFEHSGDRTTHPLTVTATDSVVIAPVGTPADWQPGGEYVKSRYPGAILSVDLTYDGVDPKTAYVIGFSSTDYISSEWVAYSSIHNMNLVLNTAKLAGGAEDDKVTFSMKTVSNESFADQVDAASSAVVFWLFVIALPIALIAVGIAVFVRRKNR